MYRAKQNKRTTIPTQRGCAALCNAPSQSPALDFCEQLITFLVVIFGTTALIVVAILVGVLVGVPLSGL
jgi:hypothetical protein